MYMNIMIKGMSKQEAVRKWKTRGAILLVDHHKEWTNTHIHNVYVHSTHINWQRIHATHEKSTSYNLYALSDLETRQKSQQTDKK